MINEILVVSLIANVFLGWYLIVVLKKLLYISTNLSDLFLTVKAFRIFVANLYSMDSFTGEPMIEELIYRLRIVSDEIDGFREIFEYTIDTEMEEELDGAQEDL
tara:strand:+ start:357 stop:668 length:312 start_codon:yes stop_codon:yes gene_type:complete